MTDTRIGVDIGGTKVDAVVVDQHGDLLHRHRVAVERGPQGVVRSATAAVAQVARDAGVRISDLPSIGVGIPGAIEHGIVRHALNLELVELDLAARLRNAWGVPVAVENDVNAAAWGAWHRAGGEHRSVAYLNVGTGLAAGVILDGRLWRGARGAAGEIGHISIDPHGPLDGDGLPGGLETYASGSGMVRQWGRPGADARDVVAAADGGEELAQRIVAQLYYGIACALRVLVLTYDVDEVVLGGGLTGMGSRLTDGVGRVIDGWADESAFLSSLDLRGRSRLLDPGVPLAAIGAALVEVEHG